MILISVIFPLLCTICGSSPKQSVNQPAVIKVRYWTSDKLLQVAKTWIPGSELFISMSPPSLPDLIQAELDDYTKESQFGEEAYLFRESHVLISFSREYGDALRKLRRVIWNHIYFKKSKISSLKLSALSRVVFKVVSELLRGIKDNTLRHCLRNTVSVFLVGTVSVWYEFEADDPRLKKSGLLEEFQRVRNFPKDARFPGPQGHIPLNLRCETGLVSFVEKLSCIREEIRKDSMYTDVSICDPFGMGSRLRLCMNRCLTAETLQYKQECLKFIEGMRPSDISAIEQRLVEGTSWFDKFSGTFALLLVSLNNRGRRRGIVKIELPSRHTGQKAYYSMGQLMAEVGDGLEYSGERPEKHYYPLKYRQKKPFAGFPAEIFQLILEIALENGLQRVCLLGVCKEMYLYMPLPKDPMTFAKYMSFELFIPYRRLKEWIVASSLTLMSMFDESVLDYLENAFVLYIDHAYLKSHIRGSRSLHFSRLKNQPFPPHLLETLSALTCNKLVQMFQRILSELENRILECSPLIDTNNISIENYLCQSRIRMFEHYGMTMYI